jgi:phosphoribosyl-ATP pyrophosphohydrolase/phosphoribosyl-AMP cyclohydrolase/histidinol dehydrogenase
LAYGIDGLAATDVVVGPGNAWVTAAKKLVSGLVGIDTLAGPSELVVLADGSADAACIAADLLAQAEHDTEALPVLVTVDESLADAVDLELTAQLETLPTAVTARAALARGFTVVAASVEEAIEVSDALAPEHLQVCARDAEAWAARCRHYGAVFVGERSAEVAGDYGAGPNHTLPTGGASRFSGGLSVYHFVRVRTWLALSDDAGARELYEDARDLARVEGLEAHARAAERRLRGASRPAGVSGRPEESRTAGSTDRRHP